MSFEKVSQGEFFVVGIKQTKKAIVHHKVEYVYIANDADAHIIQPINELCKNYGIQVKKMDSMKKLGKICGIEVGAATAALLK